MSIRERLSGNEAVAYAMKQINPDVMGAYPITPSTEIPQYFSAYVDNGEVDTDFIAVESEHSAMSTCIGAEAAGCRAISATSSCGLIYMAEMLYVAASDPSTSTRIPWPCPGLRHWCRSRGASPPAYPPDRPRSSNGSLCLPHIPTRSGPRCASAAGRCDSTPRRRSPRVWWPSRPLCRS